MQRLIAILVLVLLPMQWSYAAMSNYCGHEVMLSAKLHVGHHEHKHSISAYDTGKKDGGKKDAAGYDDPDCPTCHVTFAFSENMLGAAAPPQAAGTAILFHGRSIPDRSPDNPFRPPHIAGA